MKRIEKQNIIEALSAVITADDHVIVIHSNVFSFGYMKKNIVTEFMDAILEVVGPDRTLLMPAFTLSFPRNRWYHYLETPSEMGILSEHFRQLDDVKRTICPMDSFSITGPETDLFMQQRNGQTCWGRDSVFGLLYEKNALIIGLGEFLAESASIFHFAEEIVSVPYRFFKPFSGKADFGEGPQDTTREFYVRRMDIPINDRYYAPVEQLRQDNKIRTVKLGMSFIESCRSTDAVDCLVAMLRNDPLALLLNRKEYEEQLARKCFCFMGSSNTDLMTKQFFTEYERTTQESCRQILIPYGQYRQMILNAASDLRVADPDYLVFIERAEEILEHVLRYEFRGKNKREQILERIETALKPYFQIIAQARQWFKGFIIVANFACIRPSIWGNADQEAIDGHESIIALANQSLRQHLQQLHDVHVLDYQALVFRHGGQNAFAVKYWYLGRIPFTKSFSQLISRTIIGMALALQGRTIRMIVLDLDNTLWRGVIGDDGIAGIELGGDYPGNMFKEWQYFLKSLTRRGIILAVCSKNEYKTAMEAIEEHPEMVLRKKDFTSFRINWENKADNIQAICNEVNLGPYSVMFLDDNPVEREMVRRHLPECIVPELPEDVSTWIDFIAESPFFQAVTVTKEDLDRGRQYARFQKMKNASASQTNVEDFLRSLGMKVAIAPYSETNRARIIQLITKTNQFNTTTKRYKQGDIQELIKKRNARVLAISMEDQYFQKEIIGCAILIPSDSSTRIDTFILSCRVLGRDIEKAVLGAIAIQSHKHGQIELVGELVPTPKNTPVMSLYSGFGFKKYSDHEYRLDLIDHEGIKIPDYIQVEFEEKNDGSDA